MNMRAIFYDTETTGVRSDKDYIIEIAAYDPANDRTFVSFVNPGVPIPAEASAIHQITDAMVASAPSFAKVGQDFLEFCSGDAVLIAHNNDNFDLLFLKNEFSRHGITMPSLKFIDTLKWARRYRPDLPRHSLQFLRGVFGIEANNAHRALDDVIILHKVFSLMVGDLPLEKVYGLLNTPKQMQHMPFGKHQGMPLTKIPADYIKWLAGSGAFDKPENKELKVSLETIGLLPAGK